MAIVSCGVSRPHRPVAGACHWSDEIGIHFLSVLSGARSRNQEALARKTKI